MLYNHCGIIILQYPVKNKMFKIGQNVPSRGQNVPPGGQNVPPTVQNDIPRD
jgi:hypothetical protein